MNTFTVVSVVLKRLGKVSDGRMVIPRSIVIVVAALALVFMPVVMEYQLVNIWNYLLGRLEFVAFANASESIWRSTIVIRQVESEVSFAEAVMLHSVGLETIPIFVAAQPNISQVVPPPYNRVEWGGFIDSDADCQDSRQEVLIDESLVAPRLSSDGCRVVSGQWLDVYTGEVYTDPGALDVDHVVSLGAAHRMGGWRWTRDRKRDYANDLAHADHLVAVLARVNRQKSDHGPRAWLPPRAPCAYVATYQAIARRWGLTLDRADADAIARVEATCQN